MNPPRFEGLIPKLTAPDRLYAPSEILAAIKDRAATGVYAWWFKGLPANVPLNDAVVLGEWTLLYVGTSTRPIRERIRDHLRPDSSRSTLRLSLGCLLSDQLELKLRVCRTVKGKPKFDLGDGESALAAWMESNARISWVEHPEPLVLESYLISVLKIPLNLDGNTRHPFCQVLGNLRSTLKQRAT